MYGAKVEVVYDLGGKTAKRHEQIRDELLEAVKDDKIKTYSGTFMGMSVRSVGGTLIAVSYNNWSQSDDLWGVFDGLKTVRVRVEDAGTDHFPAPGFYHGDTLGRRDIKGASAVVRWSTDIEYPAREELLEAVVSNSATNDYARELTLNVPVVLRRSWRMILVARSTASAMIAHELLRTGQWEPRSRFVDAMPDIEKVRQVPIRVEPGEFTCEHAR